jgi:hypothetical protein
VKVAAVVAFTASLAFSGDEGLVYPHGDFEEDCSMCHRPDAWTPVEISPEFDHGKRGFDLDASHDRADCRACHASLEFGDVSTACASCHADVHRGELGPDCERCHTTRSFIDRFAMVRSHQATRFPLSGAHRISDCEDCHLPVDQGGYQFVNTPVDCVACHLKEYQATADPDHQVSGFPPTCEACHTTVAWAPAGFNHALAAGTPCATCHLDDYLATTDPNHQTEGISQQCQDCHSTTSWAFNHALAAGTPCATCHLDDYQVTTDPNHQTAGFSQQCESCHNTRRWIPASFDGLNHDAAFFPIFSGRHRGKWDRCSDCHVNPNSYATFECIQCHAHDNPQELAGHHDEVSGYTYDSQACYSCHPQGDEE